MALFAIFASVKSMKCMSLRLKFTGHLVICDNCDKSGPRSIILFTKEASWCMLNHALPRIHSSSSVLSLSFFSACNVTKDLTSLSVSK